MGRRGAASPTVAGGGGGAPGYGGGLSGGGVHAPDGGSVIDRDGSRPRVGHTHVNVSGHAHMNAPPSTMNVWPVR